MSEELNITVCSVVNITEQVIKNVSVKTGKDIAFIKKNI